MASSGLEIERKYLLDGPPSGADLAELGARATQIEQVYLLSADSWVRRVRRIEVDGRARHVLTLKRDRAGIVRDELERDVSPEEYGRLLAEADPARRVIRKVRHVIPYGRWTLELDVFSEPPGLVLLEVELDDPAEVPDIPPSIAARVVREVSSEPAYANYRLALRPAVDLAGLPARVPGAAGDEPGSPVDAPAPDQGAGLPGDAASAAAAHASAAPAHSPGPASHEPA